MGHHGPQLATKVIGRALNLGSREETDGVFTIPPGGVFHPHLYPPRPPFMSTGNLRM